MLLRKQYAFFDMKKISRALHKTENYIKYYKSLICRHYFYVNIIEKLVKLLY